MNEHITENDRSEAIAETLTAALARKEEYLHWQRADVAACLKILPDGGSAITDVLIELMQCSKNVKQVAQDLELLSEMAVGCGLEWEPSEAVTNVRPLVLDAIKVLDGVTAEPFAESDAIRGGIVRFDGIVGRADDVLRAGLGLRAQ